MMLDRQIGFIGDRADGRALARGVVRGLIAPSQLIAFDPDADARRAFSSELPQSRLARDNAEVVAQASVVVLAVKPQSLTAVSQSLQAQATSGKLFISILARSIIGRIAARIAIRPGSSSHAEYALSDWSRGGGLFDGVADRWKGCPRG